MLRLFAALTLGLWAGVAGAQTSNCMAASEAGGCNPNDTHSDGLLRQGAHVAFTLPTKRYAHGVLGDAVEWGGLSYIQQGSRNHGPYLIVDFELPKSRVFEDLRPRLIDMDGDGSFEIVVVESHQSKGAQLAIYKLAVEPDFALKKIAATPHIGQRNRWLAPVGAVDFDGDGNIEIAYVDRPHLAKTLRIWRFIGSAVDGTAKLTELASLPGVTNHRIGEDFISGGVRTCGSIPEMVVASSDWRKVVRVQYLDGQIRRSFVDMQPTPANFARLLACK